MTAPKHSPDYGRLKSGINKSKSKQEDNALYQTVGSLIDGTKRLNDFIDASFLSVFGSLNSAAEVLSTFSLQLLELQLALTNRNLPGSISDGTISLPDNLLTVLAEFTTLFAAQYNINSQLAFDTNSTGTRFLGIYVDGVLKRRVQVDGQINGQTSIAVSALVLCGAGSLIQVGGFQDSGGSLTVDFSADLIRLSYV